MAKPETRPFRPTPARSSPTAPTGARPLRPPSVPRGGTPRIVATHLWGQDEAETLARLDAWNAPIHRIRGRVEKVFGTWKRSYGLRRMRWVGLAKATLQVHLTAIAYNIRRVLGIVAAA
ncbi:transposase [Prosthecomicrobium hirschii]|nr:transposase [Prosthecomicrobium hirschii]MCW1840406.1 transposase [Prosthecomicrobium hirschii]MCW1843788.1 transposase [Prosthecomicrobium hirschii]